jgi:hypothetical protein
MFNTLASDAVTPTPPDFSSTAGLYSQLAGVLAGFAFAGLVALVVAQFTSGTTAKFSFESFVPLISSFIGLVGTSLNYAIIAGEGQGYARAALLETVGGLGFAVAGLMLFYSLVVLLHGARADATASPQGTNSIITSAVTFTRLTLVLGVAPAVIVLLAAGVADQETLKYGSNSRLHWLDYVAMGLLLVIFVVGVIVTWRNRRKTGTTTPPSGNAISGWAIALALLCVGFTTGISVYASPTAIGPDVIRLAPLLILFFFDLSVIKSAAQYR